MADQTLPQNFLVIVDTSVEASSSFNAACWMVRSLNLALPPEMERKNKVFLLHLSRLKPKGIFPSTGAFDIHYSLIGIFCENKSMYVDKIHMLIDRFDIGTVFLGDPDLVSHSHLRANIFYVRRRMGFVWDKSFLKASIHNVDVSSLKSYDESTGLSGYDAKLETDYVEYRFLVPPQYSEFEKSVIIAETCGQPVPIAAKEELIRKTSLENIQGFQEEAPTPTRKVSNLHARDAIKEEKLQARETEARDIREATEREEQKMRALSGNESLPLPQMRVGEGGGLDRGVEGKEEAATTGIPIANREPEL